LVWKTIFTFGLLKLLKLVSIEVASMNDESAYHLLVVNPCSKNYVTYALEAYNITPPILYIGYFSPIKIG
jgi:hypothetical protein